MANKYHGTSSRKSSSRDSYMVPSTRVTHFTPSGVMGRPHDMANPITNQYDTPEMIALKKKRNQQR